MVSKILIAPDWTHVRAYAEAKDMPPSKIRTEYVIVTGPDDLNKIQGLNRDTTEVVLINGGPKLTWDEWTLIGIKSLKFLNGEYTRWRNE